MFIQMNLSANESSVELMPLPFFFPRQGIIDPDYTGTIKVLLQNSSNDPRWIRAGDKIAQIIVVNYTRVYATNLISPPTESPHELKSRGDRGLGSTRLYNSLDADYREAQACKRLVEAFKQDCERELENWVHCAGYASPQLMGFWARQTFLRSEEGKRLLEKYKALHTWDADDDHLLGIWIMHALYSRTDRYFHLSEPVTEWMRFSVDGLEDLAQLMAATMKETPYNYAPTPRFGKPMRFRHQWSGPMRCSTPTPPAAVAPQREQDAADWDLETGLSLLVESINDLVGLLQRSTRLKIERQLEEEGLPHYEEAVQHADTTGRTSGLGSVTLDIEGETSESIPVISVAIPGEEQAQNTESEPEELLEDSLG